MADPTQGVQEAKREMRREMRCVRLEAADDERSRRICAALTVVVAKVDPASVMVFDAVPGEPDLTEFASWCGARLINVVTPDPSPAAAPPSDPSVLDVFVVPGLAFSVHGHRLGQGGGWYDRVLARRRAGAVVIGVGFDEQLVESVVVEPHDVLMDLVVTDERVVAGSSRVY